MTSSNGLKTHETQSEIDEEKEEQDVLNFDKPNFEFIPKGNHLWRQEGPYLICRNCELEHAVFIGMNKVMTGISKDGQPTISSRAKTGG